MTIRTVLLVVAALLFLLATFGVNARVNLVAAGLFCATLAELLVPGRLLP